jgi:hypothetical protein
MKKFTEALKEICRLLLQTLYTLKKEIADSTTTSSYPRSDFLMTDDVGEQSNTN